MANDRIDIVFGAEITDLVAGIDQVRAAVQSLTQPIGDLGSQFSVAFVAVSAAQARAAGDTRNEWTAAFNVIDRSLDTMLKGVLVGTQTWQQAMARLFDNLALAFIEAVAKMTVQWTAWLALTATLGASPVANPFAAGAGGLGGIIGGIGGLLGFAGGAWAVPQDMIAVVHAGEMILPAGLAESVRTGTAATAPASAAPSLALNVTVQAMDAAGVAQWANANAKTLAATINRYLASNPGARGDY